MEDLAGKVECMHFSVGKNASQLKGRTADVYLHHSILGALNRDVLRMLKPLKMCFKMSICLSVSKRSVVGRH